MNVCIHSECLTGDVFKSARCDCGDQLDKAMQIMSEEDGIICICARKDEASV